MILCSGKFDPLHIGHVTFLEAAKRLAIHQEELWVAILPDVDPQHTRPHFMPDHERAWIVASLRPVNRAWVYDVPTCIRLHKPRLFVKGPEWVGKVPADVVKACRDAGTELLYLHFDKQISSSQLLSQYACRLNGLALHV
jgi:D-glycero-beta-D-manno-heptose 1-phosphate adenylyltransferase